MKISIGKTNKLYKGFFDACDAVGSTLGAEGRLAVMEGDFTPTVSKDGVSLARALFAEDREENMGMFFAKQAALKTLAYSGDSTTTTLVFAKALVEATYRKKLFSSGEYYFNSKVKDGIDAGVKEATGKLKKLSKKAQGTDVYNIAKVSANNNEEIAKLVSEAYEAVGAQGVIDVQQNHDSVHTTVNISNGMRFKKGWKSPFLITDQKTATWEGKDVNIVLYEGHISLNNANEIAETLNPIQKEPILLICERMDLDVENNIVDLFNRGTLNICVVEAPFFADDRATFFKDLALYTGGEAFVQGVSEEYKFGKANKVIIEKEFTSIIQKEIPQEIKDLAENLKKQLEDNPKDDKLRMRVSNLEGKAAIISVGGMTEIEVQEKFDRVEDSVAAVKSAVQEGVISGGGSALVYVANQMKQEFPDKDIQRGYDAVVKCLSAPYKKILKNAKVKSNPYVKSIEAKYGVGYNVKTHKVENLLDNGILDSAKSIRVALENAKSVVNLLLSIEVIVSR